MNKNTLTSKASKPLSSPTALLSDWNSALSKGKDKDIENFVQKHISEGTMGELQRVVAIDSVNAADIKNIRYLIRYVPNVNHSSLVDIVVEIQHRQLILNNLQLRLESFIKRNSSPQLIDSLVNILHNSINKNPQPNTPPSDDIQMASEAEAGFREYLKGADTTKLLSYLKSKEKKTPEGIINAFKREMPKSPSDEITLLTHLVSPDLGDKLVSAFRNSVLSLAELSEPISIPTQSPSFQPASGIKNSI